MTAFSDARFANRMNSINIRFKQKGSIHFIQSVYTFTQTGVLLAADIVVNF